MIFEPHITGSVAKERPFSSSREIGKVFLVGAGPGDPDLITVKGLQCLRTAQTVVYDRLVHPSLLKEIHCDAERIFVGKEPSFSTQSQQDINNILVVHAKQGKRVVRLKGGDPFVFGRGGEEALALALAGIPFEIVPGISSAIAVPAYAGIPVTHRGKSSLLTIMTGHDVQSSSEHVWKNLAELGGTIVILMGVANLAQITRCLLVYNIHPETPAATIQDGTTSQQRVVIGTVATIAERSAQEHLRNPAITIIGAVAGLQGLLAWFDPIPAKNNMMGKCNE